MADRPSFVVEDQSEVIAEIERRFPGARRIDTHGAMVFLSGVDAYKLKRAVKFPYMDFSTAERRREMCEAEIAANHAFAPDVYTGVDRVDAPSGKIDWLVVMRRFDEACLFDKMAERGDLTEPLMAALGAKVAQVHDSLPVICAGFCLPDAYRHSVASDVRQVEDHGDRLDIEVSKKLAVALPGALEPFVELVARRVGAGAIRRCHGDLHLRNIVLIDGRPTPFDAIEFSERIANIDVMYDIAFALMDLCHRGLRPLANRLLNEWLWRIADLPEAPNHEALALLPMFLARRACVRAYVDSSITAVSGADNGPACAYQRSALAFLEPAPPKLMAVGGLSGSGKTTHALKIAPEVGRAPGAVVVRSDVERKRLAGVVLDERMPAGSYTPQSSARVYAAMLANAERALQAGHSVVLDAVFAKPEERAAAEALARAVGVPFEGTWLDVPKEVAQARVAARTGDASDATPAVVERQFGYDLGEIGWKKPAR
jgi:aminoglycoside phosphotransferase family enzyme/predicted kinase